MNPEIENQIKNNVTWNKLPSHLKQFIGNSQKEYEKAIILYCIKNQLRFKDNLVRYVRKDEKKYYEEMLEYSKANFLLYPYHLSDLFVKGLRMTPFNYYLEMMSNVIQSEKSYDTIPNFTAFDCVRLLGIGRNQYIEIMNKYRSANRNILSFVGRRKTDLKPLLPAQPSKILIEPWWLVCVGCIREEDIKSVAKEEKDLIDKIIDNVKPFEAGKLNHELVHSLYRKGLIYLDVPVSENDVVEVPPLENFVMNRTVGDSFEKLLYKIFVSIDDRTTMLELANLLQVDVDLVLNAVSLYCRLSFAKKLKLNINMDDYDSSWQNYKQNFKKPIKNGESLLEWNNDNLTKLDETNPKEEPGVQNKLHSLLSVTNSTSKKVGFLFDSTLTAFLMMGNLSCGLKNHAVTMFEVGKLTDQALDNFLSELDKVSCEQNEGEAQRYFDHAIILKSTIQFLRYNQDLKLFSGFSEESREPLESEPLGVDLLRIESLADLDDEAKQKLLAKNYTILFSMTPFNNSGDLSNSAPITCDSPFHFGSTIPEMNSVWFKLYLYNLVNDSPLGILIPHGKKLTKLPDNFKHYDKFEISSWGHDSTVASSSNILLTINDASSYAPILVECCSVDSESGFCKKNIAFNDATSPFYEHPSVRILHEKLELKHFIGYIVLLNPFRNFTSDKEIDFDEWVFYDLHYGIPLFDKSLNQQVLSLFKELHLGTWDNLNKMIQINRKLSLELLDFIQQYQDVNIFDKSFFDVPDQKKEDDYMLSYISYKSKTKLNQTKVIIKPTKYVSFENGVLKALYDV